MAWLKLLGPVLKFLSWLGTILLARKSGKDSVRKEVAENNVKAAKRIAKAVGDSPSDKRAVLGRLRSRHRKL